LRQDIFYWYIYLVQFISNLYCRVRYCLLEYTKKFNYAFEKLEFWATILSLVKTTIKWNLKMVSWEPCIRERFWLQIWILHRPADNQNIIFSCKFENCSAICKAPFRDFSNLNKHLKSHPEFTIWLQKYNKYNNKTKKNTYTWQIIYILYCIKFKFN